MLVSKQRLEVIALSIGSRIRSAREAKGLTRKELADLINVTVSAVSNYENGVSSPKEAVMLDLFSALGIDPNYLFQDEIDMSQLTTPPLTPTESSLLSNFRTLNDEGQEKLHSYSEDLVQSRRYIKNNSLGLRENA